MPFNLKDKGVSSKTAAEVEEQHTLLWSGGSKKKEGEEPRSVLDQRRSPSPPTSTSTLSSSLGGGEGGDGGEGSAEPAGVTTVSGNPLQKWQDANLSAEGGGGRKEDWVSELQPIPVEIGLMGGGGGGEKCGGGLGVGDWESMLTEEAPAAVASPGQDQSFLRWIMGDMEQQQQHHHHQMLFQGGPVSAADEFDAGGDASGFGVIEPGFGFETMGEIGSGTPLAAASSSVVSGGGFPLLSSSGGGGNRIFPISSSSPLPTIKNPLFGNNQNSIFPSPPISAVNNSFSLPPALIFQEPMEEKPQLFSPSHHLLNHQQTQASQTSSFFLPLNPYSQPEHQQQPLLFPPQPKRLHSMADPSCQIGPKAPLSNPGQDLFLRRHQPQQQRFGAYHNVQQRPMKPKLGGDETSAAAQQQQQQQQQQALVDQLFKAAELVEDGNSINARGILARLNHQLSPHGKPLVRSAFYFKEALNAIVGNNPSMPPSSSPLHHQPKPLATPLDVVLKLNAYKNFSEISPAIQFTNFTCVQALLEELSGCDHIHIVDFDVGFGGLWSSFMQELSQRRCSLAETAPSLKITAFVNPSSHHHFELVLTRENLSHFARDLNIPFEFNILNLDSFDPSAILNMSAGFNEAIAVNTPVGSSFASTLAILRLVRQLSPKIVVSVDHNCDRSDLSFSQHFLNALHSYTILLESIDAAGANLEVSNKIERYLLQPRIENIILGRYHAADEMLPWRTLFASAGFVPVSFSNFTETQAECLLKRIQVRGFQVEKRQYSLLLFWQRGELASVSAWKC